MAGTIKLDGTTFLSKSGSDFTLNNVTDIGSVTAGTIGSSVTFPAGHVIQMVSPTPTVETNTLTTSYVNLYEVPITLVGGNSKVLIIFSYNYYVGSESGLGFELRKKTSSGVGTSDTAVFTHGTGDGTGPLHVYFNATTTYNQHTIHAVDDATGHNAGNTIYYGFFFKIRSNNGAVPPDNAPDGYFKCTLLEVTA